MRTAITLAWPHGDPKPKLLSGTDVSIAEQIAAFKKIDPAISSEFERVEIWESGSGTIKRHKLIHPDESARRKKVFDAQIEAAKKAADAEKKTADKSDKTADESDSDKAAKKAAKDKK